MGGFHVNLQSESTGDFLTELLVKNAIAELANYHKFNFRI